MFLTILGHPNRLNPPHQHVHNTFGLRIVFIHFGIHIILVQFAFLRHQAPHRKILEQGQQTKKLPRYLIDMLVSCTNDIV